MKVAVPFFAFFFFCGLCFGQQNEDASERLLPPKAILKSNPFAVFQGPMKWSSEYRMTFEHVLRSRKSYVLSASYLGRSVMDNIFNNDIFVKKYQGFRGQAMLRFYLSKKYYSPRGFYVGPHASFSYLEKRESYNLYLHKEYLSYANVNFIAGYQTIIGKTLTFEIYGGLGVKQNTRLQRDSSNGNDNSQNTNIKFSFGSSVGFVL